jgi:hypothetical protein
MYEKEELMSIKEPPELILKMLVAVAAAKRHAHYTKGWQS